MLNSDYDVRILALECISLHKREIICSLLLNWKTFVVVRTFFCVLQLVTPLLFMN